MTTTTPTLSEISAMLLHDHELRKAELQRVMAEYPILTQNGFAWYLHSKNERHNELPANPEEAQAYKEARNQLAHQALSDDQCLGVTQSSPLGCKSSSHYGEILLALKYLTYCQHSIARTGSSYAVKHRAETLDHPHYVSNGAMIAAAAMASVKIYQKIIYGKPQMNAEMYINEPRICGARGVKSGTGCRKNLIPAGTKKRICDQCRNAL